MLRRLRRRPAESHALRSVQTITPAEVLEQRTLLTAYIVNTLDDAVAADGKVSLREAVQAASLNVAVNEAAAGQGGTLFDTITFDASLAGGTIVLSGTRLDVAGALSITGLGTSQLTISGNDAVQIFAVAAGANLQVSSLTLTDGFGASGLETRDGGTIVNEGALTLKYVVISDSTTAFRGAAIYNEGSVSMTGGGILNSTGTYAVENYGAGSFNAANVSFDHNLDGVIFNWKAISITACAFYDNAITGGAAVYNFGSQATASVVASQFVRNDGGAIKNQGLTFQIVDSSFLDNTAGSAGAIDNFSGVMDISGSTFASNHATTFHGGAIESSGTLRMWNSTVSGNDAAWNGGAFYIWTGVASFVNVTVVGNRGKLNSSLGNGGGFYIGGGTVTLHNSIVAGNTIEATNTPQDIVGNVSGGYNLIGTAAFAGGLVNGSVGNIVGIDWTTVLDPVLRDNGGPTMTHALIPGSAAINAGLNSAAVGPNGMPLVGDQRGLPRFAGNGVDIGAYEVPQILFVDTLVDENDGEYRAGDLSLREAISLVDNGGAVTFASSLAGGTITLTMGQLLLDKDMTIAGLGADKLTISGNDASRIFGVAAGQSVEISGLTLTGGNAGFGAGGGVNNSGTLTVTNSAITGNSAGFGGGIFNGGTLTVSASSIDGNSATRVGGGGGISNAGTLTVTASTIDGNSVTASMGFGGGIFNSGTLTFTNSTITGNSAGSGGGIFNDGTLTVRASTIAGNSASSGGGIQNNSALNLVSSTITGNTSGVNGGGIFNNGALTVANSTFSGNLASVAGGGIYNSFRTLLLTNSTISGNRADSDDDASGAGGGLAGNADGVTLRNTIVAGNFRGTGILADDISWSFGIIAAAGHNLIGNAATSGGLTNGVNGNIVGVDWTTVLDPVLRDNGGPTMTHALLRTSVAIDAGSNDGAVDADGLPLEFDQRGTGFARILRGTVDIGAFESSNAGPVARNDAFTISEDGTIAGSLFDDHGSGTDFDTDGDAITITSVTVNGVSVEIGTELLLADGTLLTVYADGSFSFDTNGVYDGLSPAQSVVQTFSYQISDGHGSTATANVTITIRGTNNAPVAVNDEVRVGEHERATGNVLANDSDADGEALQVTKVNGNALSVGHTITLSSGARLTLNADGSFTYDPNGRFVRLRRGEMAHDSFSYTTSDGFDTATATVSITIYGGGGEADLISYHNGRWVVSASDANGFVSTTWALWTAPAWANATVFRQGDFNGDGRTDVLGQLNGAWWVGISNGSAFVASRWGAWSNLDWRDVRIADLNGDGKDDVLARFRGSWWASLSDGSSFGTATRWVGWSDLDWRHAMLADLNGDGQQDLLANLNGSWWATLSNGQSFGWTDRWGAFPRLEWDAVGTADVNNDGMADVYAFSRGTWYVGLSSGHSFFVAKWAAWRDAAWQDAVVGDFNGDGRDDFAARLGRNWWVSLTKSDGTAGGATAWATWQGSDWSGARVGDFDGDGLDDIVARNGGAWQVGISTGYVFASSSWGGDALYGSLVGSASDADGPPALPTAPTEEAPLARYWSSVDDDELAHLLSIAV